MAEKDILNEELEEIEEEADETPEDDVELEGIEEGIEQNKIAMIKGMLKENIDIKTISKVASIPINEIKKIEKSLKD